MKRYKDLGPKCFEVSIQKAQSDTTQPNFWTPNRTLCRCLIVYVSFYLENNKPVSVMLIKFFVPQEGMPLTNSTLLTN